MQTIKPITKSKDLKAGWKKFDNYNHTAQLPVVMITLQELSHINGNYPIAFAKINEKEYRLVAMLGLFENENLFINEEGKWLSSYTPAHFRSYPFMLSRVKSEEENKQIFCIDMQSGLYRENPIPEQGEERFFNDDGTLADKTQKTLNFLEALMKNTRLTQKAVDELVSHELLLPLQWTSEAKNEQQKPIKGLYIIDEKKLNSLEPKALKELRDTNALAVAYTQLLSMSNIELLQQLQDAKNKRKEETKFEDFDLDAIFGESSSNKLNFDL